jgi:ribosomal protein S18 acetylase RimI-like enzyme
MRAAMERAPVAADRDCRLLGADDLAQVIAIDRAHSGHSRHRFFEKRFAAAKAQPDDFIHVGIAEGRSLRGFAVARVLRGEFGHEQAVAVLDAIGVAAESREQGIGQALMRELSAVMHRRGVHVLQSQADWTNQELMHFFAAAGFKLAPRLTLQRAVATLPDEASEEV